MRSNYNPIGQYIRLVDNRNKELKDLPLVGVTVNKKFIPSVANTIGTNMKNYKLIKKDQFACSLMQVRRDGKIPVALFENEEAIISQAYPVFEIIDTKELLPKYLMMWMSRSEFDREACFYAVGGVRGSLEWEDFCAMKLPVPSPEKQREIVKEYHAITDRIKLNEQLNQQLEDTAQSIYKEWFVNFEFPDENGKPYKSNGGEMEYSNELDIEVPKGWSISTIESFADEMKSGGTPNRANIEYWDKEDIPWIKTGELQNKVLIHAEESISNEGCKNSSAKVLPINTVLIAMYGQGNTKGQVAYLRFEATTNQACCAMICDNELESSYLFNYLKFNRNEIVNLANGGAQPNLSKELIANLKIIKPSKNILNNHPFIKLINHSELMMKENLYLLNLKEVLLSKMATVEG